MQIELHVEGRGALLDAISNARIDLDVLIEHENHDNAQTVGRLDLVWLASSTSARPTIEKNQIVRRLKRRSPL